MKLAKILIDKDLAVRSKVWLELNGRPFFGEGRYNILKSIDRHGSITRAAEETGVSYRKIRGAIYLMEKIIGMNLVIRSRGGAVGGGAVITETARELMSLFEKQEKGMRKSVDELYRQTFEQHKPLYELTDNEATKP
ncbi:MAG: LysR family transcriptional regulator [Desulfuromonadaceae bacterium]|nr:LysR family transcriptional regulator [Desulfuromonadaceae bacterium]